MSATILMNELRDRIARRADEIVDHLVEVATGKRQARNVEVSAAKLLLAKIMPDLSAIALTAEPADVDVRKLSRDQLLRIIETEAQEEGQRLLTSEVLIPESPGPDPTPPATVASHSDATRDA